MDLVLERRVSCSPEVAFSLLSHPDEMNAWSTAKITAHLTGDQNHPASIGATRRVQLPWRPFGSAIVLKEYIEESRAPELFIYRVIDDPMITNHRGTITIRPDSQGCVVRWRVQADFALSPLAPLIERALRRELERSLDAMSRIAPSHTALQTAPSRDIDEPTILEHCYQQAETCLQEQRAQTDSLRKQNDARWWFTQTYAHVSALQIEACRNGTYQHPGWVLRLIPQFHHYYMRSLRPALEKQGELEPHWANAFQRMKKTEGWSHGRFYSMGYCIYHGMRAHIEEDLPRALADIFLAHYADRCDYARFRGDYLGMGPVFREATEAMMQLLQPAEVPLQTRLAQRFIPTSFSEAFRAKKFYNIPQERLRAFERGGELVAQRT